MLIWVDRADLVQRLRTCVAIGQGADLETTRHALEALEETLSSGDRRYHRDQHILRAAACLDGTRWARAQRLASEAAALERCWVRLRFQTPEHYTVQGELHAARLEAPLPKSARQYANLMEMSWDEISADRS
jgi:hypothetical protein